MDLLTSPRAIPKHRLALTVLAATSCFVMSVLSLWLAFWLFFIRPDLNVLAIWSVRRSRLGPRPNSSFKSKMPRSSALKARGGRRVQVEVVESIREFLEE